MKQSLHCFNLHGFIEQVQSIILGLLRTTCPTNGHVLFRLVGENGVMDLNLISAVIFVE